MFKLSEQQFNFYWYFWQSGFFLCDVDVELDLQIATCSLQLYRRRKGVTAYTTIIVHIFTYSERECAVAYSNTVCWHSIFVPFVFPEYPIGDNLIGNNISGSHLQNVGEPCRRYFVTSLCVCSNRYLHFVWYLIMRK